MAERRQGTPLWVTLGCGCCLFVLVVIGAIVAAGYFSVSAVKDYVEDLRDPAARAAKAAEILGAPRLPEGYVAQIYLRIPWVLDMVFLSDGEAVVPENDDFDFDTEQLDRFAFIYFVFRQGSLNEEEIDDMLQGRRTSRNVKVDVGLKLEPAEELARGTFELEPQRMSYAAYRGEVYFDNAAMSGIYSRVLIDCPGDRLTRVAVWFQRDPRLEGVGTLDVAGSPAEEAVLRDFMAHFDVCGD